MSSPPLRVFLTKPQETTLFELSRASRIAQRTRDRASAIRLSSIGWKVEKIAIYLKWSKQTVREAIHRTRKSLKGKQNPLEVKRKKNNLEMLEWAAAVGEICLKYLKVILN